MENILIIHHNDRDGLASAAVVANAIIARNNADIKIDYLEENYTKSYTEFMPAYVISLYKEIYIVDYSVSTESDIKWLISASKSETHITWIDHHITSIQAEDKYGDDLKSIDGIRIDGISGAALCWMWCNGYRDKLEALKALNNSKVTPEYTRQLLIEVDCPKLIQYTHRYDIWDHSLEDPIPLYFNYGDRHMLNWWVTAMGLSTEEINDIAISEIEDGKLKYDEIAESNKKLCNDNGYATSLTVGGTTYSVFAINKIGGSSLIFGEKINEYDIVSVFWYSGPDKCFRYSIYSRTPDGVDVSKIAKILGGGGHPHAAGFRSNTILYK